MTQETIMRPWSFSSLNLYQNCPRQYELTKVKNVIPYTETKETLWGTEVHSALEAGVRDGTPTSPNMAAFEKWAQKIRSMTGELHLEKEYALTRNLVPTEFDAEDAWCRGIIDIAVVDKNLRRAFVGDWKSGKVRPDSDQLKLFAAFIMAHHAEVDLVKTAYIWLAHGKTTTEVYHRSDLPEIWKHFMTKVARLENSYKNDRWIPKTSGLCNGWCGAGTAHCEFWKPRRA